MISPIPRLKPCPPPRWQHLYRDAMAALGGQRGWTGRDYRARNLACAVAPAAPTWSTTCRSGSRPAADRNRGKEPDREGERRIEIRHQVDAPDDPRHRADAEAGAARLESAPKQRPTCWASTCSSRRVTRRWRCPRCSKLDAWEKANTEQDEAFQRRISELAMQDLARH